MTAVTSSLFVRVVMLVSMQSEATAGTIINLVALSFRWVGAVYFSVRKRPVERAWGQTHKKRNSNGVLTPSQK